MRWGLICLDVPLPEACDAVPALLGPGDRLLSRLFLASSDLLFSVVGPNRWAL